MKNHVIIAGLGDIGYHLAINLISLKIPVAVIEKNKDILEKIPETELIKIINASSEVYNSLIKANINEAKIILATLKEDAQNILVSSLSKALNPKITTIARIRNKNLLNARYLHKVLNIDIPIYPEKETAGHLFEILEYKKTRDYISLLEEKVVIRGLKVDKNSKLTGMTLFDIKNKFQKYNFLIAAITRENEAETIIPNGQEKIELFDIIYVFMNKKDEEVILKKFGYRKNKIKNALVVGASSYGTLIVEESVKRKISAKLIEIDRQKAKKLDELLPDTVILNLDGTKKTALIDNGVGSTDLFVSATTDGFNNIISCKFSKNEGAKNTVSLTFNKSIYTLSYMLGVDICLNPHYTVIDRVLSLYYPKNIKSVKTLGNEDAAIIEVDIDEDFFVVNKKLKDLILGNSVLVGLIKRDDITFLPGGDDYIIPNDTVFLFLLKRDINRVLDKFFNNRRK